jgi:hypothetical protein
MFQTAFQANAFQVNAFQINTSPTPVTNLGGGDDASWTHEELRRIKRIQQKIAERQRLLEKATKDANASRKQAFRNQIDPVAKVKQSKVQSKQEVKADIPLAETEDLQRSISYLERQRDNILAVVAYRNEMARMQYELQVLEAKRQEELDDEQALLFLI